MQIDQLDFGTFINLLLNATFLRSFYGMGTVISNILSAYL